MDALVRVLSKFNPLCLAISTRLCSNPLAHSRVGTSSTQPRVDLSWPLKITMGSKCTGSYFVYTTYTCVSNGDPLSIETLEAKKPRSLHKKNNNKTQRPTQSGERAIGDNTDICTILLCWASTPKTQAAGYTRTTMYLVLIQVHCWVAK